MTKPKTPAAKTLQGIEHLAIRDLQRLADVETAARDMLAALQAAEEHVGVVQIGRGLEAIAAREQVAAAIAAAKAAGITAN
jgi:hypothetical protein